MIVVRLVVLGILFYIAMLLVRGIFGVKKQGRKKEKKQTVGNSSVQDVLVEDPVCKTLVPRHQAIRLRDNGKTYYFCSETCCDKFSVTLRKDA